MFNVNKQEKKKEYKAMDEIQLKKIKYMKQGKRVRNNLTFLKNNKIKEK